MKERVIEVEISVGNRLNRYKSSDGFRIALSGEKFSRAIPSTLSIEIAGLSTDTRNELLSQPTGYVTAYVGRGDSLSSVFSGEVWKIEPGPAPDMAISMQAVETGPGGQRPLSVSAPSKSTVKAISAMVARELGLGLELVASDDLSKIVEGFRFDGGAFGAVRALERLGAKAYVDGDVLVVGGQGQRRTGVAPLVAASSGMIGVPEVTPGGVRVSSLIGETIPEIGGGLRVVSKVEPRANGLYVIESLTFSASTHDSDFSWTATGRRVGE